MGDSRPAFTQQVVLRHRAAIEHLRVESANTRLGAGGGGGYRWQFRIVDCHSYERCGEGVADGESAAGLAGDVGSGSWFSFWSWRLRDGSS